MTDPQIYKTWLFLIDHWSLYAMQACRQKLLLALGGGGGGTILYKTFPDFYIFHIKVIVPAKNIHPGPSKMK